MKFPEILLAAISAATTVAPSECLLINPSKRGTLVARQDHQLLDYRPMQRRGIPGESDTRLERRITPLWLAPTQQKAAKMAARIAAGDPASTLPAEASMLWLPGTHQGAVDKAKPIAAAPASSEEAPVKPTQENVIEYIDVRLPYVAAFIKFSDPKARNNLTPNAKNRLDEFELALAKFWEWAELIKEKKTPLHDPAAEKLWNEFYPQLGLIKDSYPWW